MNEKKSTDYKNLVEQLKERYHEYRNYITPTAADKKCAQNFFDENSAHKNFWSDLEYRCAKWEKSTNETINNQRACESLAISIANGYDLKNKVALFAPVINGETFCKEINLYTYWQGFGYAEKTPEIKYLLVAQDWGNPFLDKNKYFMERIERMNDGDKTASYFVDDDKIYTPYTTDENLAELFEVLGYKNIMTQRYDDLFFTNLCLGYRIGKEGGGMTEKIMMNDAEEFKRLCEILEPKNILCLGKITSECAYKALTGKNLKIGDFNKFLNNPTKFSVKVGNIEAKFYPLAHCGDYGTMNRNKVYKNGKFVCVPDSKDLEKQKQDWKKVAEDNI